MRIILYLTLFLTTHVLMAHPATNFDFTPCFNMEEVQQIGRQINQLLHYEFCVEKVDPKKFAPITQKVLAKIMTPSFLGVAPPENWQELSDSIIKNCFSNKNPCKKEPRKEVELCLVSQLPLIFIQFGPWLSENCTQLNNTLIKEWENKKNILKKVILENKE